MAKKKFKVNHRVRNIFIQVIVLLFLFVGIGYATLSTHLDISGILGVSKYEIPINGKLYNVLYSKARINSLVCEYTGNHRDSVTLEPTKKIYHWCPNNSSEKQAVKNQFNVIFAGQCWQMIRTTDTGGIKLLYNGEAENEQCLSTRGNHVGYSGVVSQTLSNSYYYGSDYIYDSTNNQFFLSGTINTGTISIGSYTCLNNSEDPCSTLYLIESQQGTKYNMIKIVSNVSYGTIGGVPFNLSYSGISSVGYMYGKNSPSNTKSKYSESMKILDFRTVSDRGLWFSDSIVWDNESSSYQLVNPYQVSNYDDYLNIEGVYTFFNTDSSYISDTVYYITGVSDVSTFHNTSYIFSNISISSGNSLNDVNTVFLYGNSYVDNGDGTYSIIDGSSVYLSDISSGHEPLLGKYYCENPIDGKCSGLLYVVSGAGIYITAINSSHFYRFSNSFTYSNGVYHLSNDSSVPKENAHYTCWNQTGVCTTVSYVFNVSLSDIYGDYSWAYYDLMDGEGIEDMLEDGFQNNINSSIIKFAIDKWYQKYLNDYTSFVEDTVFCNDRSFDHSVFNKDTGKINMQGFYFSARNSSDLDCGSVYDQFSVGNSLAHLDYPVGLMTIGEYNLFRHSYSPISDSSTVLLTSNFYTNDYGYYFATVNDPYVSIFQDTDLQVNYSFSVRPMISLSSILTFTLGDGSMENPYYILIPE